MNRQYQAYYTRSQPILSYMVGHLRPRAHSRMLEPCAGDGFLIDAVLSAENDITVDAYELDPDAARRLRSKYGSDRRITVYESDTLLDQDLLFRMSMGGDYDLAIANPPYGAWQDFDKRRKLRSLYPGLYVRETYALFLHLSLRLLKPGGRLVFIIPDTYLNLHMHRAVRRVILEEACIEDIALFPSSFFPGVCFGYSDLSIITLRRAAFGERIDDNTITVTWGYDRAEQLSSGGANVRRMLLRQGSLRESIDQALFVTEQTVHSSLVMRPELRIADVAECVTGIYTGDDKLYLRVLSHEVRNGKKYETVAQGSVYRGERPPLNGLRGQEHFVPVVKGGGVRFMKPDLWFLDWSANAVANYRTSRKARFQNSSFYFRRGIAVPMVSSSSVTASLMENRIFDQSIVGVFPRDDRYILYLLGFFNSALCTTLLRTINPSANNSANYVKKLPFVAPTVDQLAHVNRVVSRLLGDVRTTGGYREADLRELNAAYEAIYLNGASSPTDRDASEACLSTIESGSGTA
jgi:adenine-specific DNA-methyltransferase